MARLALILPEELFQAEIEDLLRILEDLPWLYQISLACHPRTPSSLLWHAAKTSRDWAWRVAWFRENLPEDLAWNLLLHLGLDPRFPGIPGHAARNPSLREDMLVVLTELGGLDARYNLLCRNHVTDRVLRRLARDPDRDIRKTARRRIREEMVRSFTRMKEGRG